MAASDPVFWVCRTCTAPLCAGDVAQGLAAAGLPVRMVDCMAGCDRPRAVALQAAGKASYLFGDIVAPDDVAALVAFAPQYQRSADGWTKATDRPAPLLQKTLARLPGALGAGAP